MVQSRRGKSVLATVVGYVLVAVIVYFALRIFVGTLFWLIRTIIVIVIIGGLFTLYVRLKTPRQ